MRRCATLDEYLGDPIGSYTVGSIYFAWCHSAHLSGLAFWGRLGAPHATWLAAVRASDVNGSDRHSVIDLRRVQSMHPMVLDSLTDYLRARAETPRGCASAVALLRPEGIIGVTLGGLCRVYDFAYPLDVFTDPHEALTWLGVADASAVVAEIEHVLGAVADATATVRALRVYLAQNPGQADVTTAATALHLSSRTLQRKLQEACTSFQAEQNAVQIELAKELLRDTDHDIKRIAFEVGCSSLAAFSALFRRIEGEAPSQWRRRTCSQTALLDRTPSTNAIPDPSRSIRAPEGRSLELRRQWSR